MLKGDWSITFLANPIKKKKLQINMMRNLPMRNFPNNTFFSQASNILRTNHSQLLSSLNHRTIQLVFSNPANAAFFQVTNSSNTITSNTTPKTPLHQLHVSPFSRPPILWSVPPGHQMNGQRQPN